MEKPFPAVAFGLAKAVAALLAKSGARERFVAQIKEAVSWRLSAKKGRFPPPPFPPPTSRKVLLAEKYEVLAAFYDHYWVGDEKLDPWAGAYNKKTREQTASYGLLVLSVQPGRLTKDHMAVVRAWLTDVQADLTRALSLVPLGAALDDVREKILRRMAQAPLRLFSIVDFSNVSNKTAGNCVNEMLTLGWAIRPKGKNGGVQVTLAGLKIAEQAGIIDRK
jgi:hypothetical protein